MAKPTLFDRLNQELEAFGKKAHAALDEGKLQIDLMRVRRKRDSAARDLGLLVYKRERGSEVEARRTDALLAKLDNLEAELSRLANQLEEARRQRPTRSAAGAGRPRSGSAEPTQPGAADPTQPGAAESSEPAAAEPTQPAAGASA